MAEPLRLLQPPPISQERGEVVRAGQRAGMVLAEPRLTALEDAAQEPLCLRYLAEVSEGEAEAAGADERRETVHAEQLLAASENLAAKSLCLVQPPRFPQQRCEV